MEAITVKRDAKTEFTEKKSVFISRAFFVTTEEEAEAKLAEVRAEHSDATHNCWAYNLRQFGKQRCSDDGEPQGTAGMPILNVIKAQGVVDVLVVVTRYFGGILLGAGGLVRAYAKGASQVLDAAEKAPIIKAVSFEALFGYDKHKTVNKVLEKYSLSNQNVDFSENIRLTGEMPEEEYLIFEQEIKNIYYTGLDLNKTGEKLSRKQ